MLIYIHILSYYKLFLYFDLCLSVILDSYIHVLSYLFTTVSTIFWYSMCTSSSYSETWLHRTPSKLKTCLIQTDFTVTSTKCLCNFNLCKPNTCLNWTKSSVPKGFGIDRFYCTLHITWLIYSCLFNTVMCRPNDTFSLQF